MTTDKKANKTSQSIFSNLFSDNTAKQAVNKASQTTTFSENPVDGSVSGATHTATQTQAKSNPTPEAVSEPKKPQEIRTYDVSIAGTTYPINCPVDEKADLDKAVLYINHFIREIRKDAPTLGHENILVLCCLNMYEEMNQEKNTQASLQQKDKKMQALIAKITKDAQSIITA